MSHYSLNKCQEIIVNDWMAKTKQYPFGSLKKVGDTFVIPQKYVEASHPEPIYQAANEFAKAHTGFRISTRIREDNSRIVMRIH